VSTLHIGNLVAITLAIWNTFTGHTTSEKHLQCPQADHREKSGSWLAADHTENAVLDLSGLAGGNAGFIFF